MIVVTGAAGFIGSNIIKGLNAIGMTDILAVDDLSDGYKFHNLMTCGYQDYMDYEDFLRAIQRNQPLLKPIEVIFHQGACSDTTLWDGRYMMRNNYDYSKALLHYSLDHNIHFLYASSAAVYGQSKNFKEATETQQPLNIYGYSKWRFDCYVLPYLRKAKSQIVGLRYFNVYGPQEQHKGRMASVGFHFMKELFATGIVRLFEGSHGYEDGEHCRDFIYIDDVVAINVWFLLHPDKRGIYNVGTGQARSFNDLAKILIQQHGSGHIEYIPFLQKLRPVYQSFTQADISALRMAGYNAVLTSLEVGLEKYYRYFCARYISKDCALYP